MGEGSASWSSNPRQPPASGQKDDCPGIRQLIDPIRPGECRTVFIPPNGEAPAYDERNDGQCPRVSSDFPCSRAGAKERNAPHDNGGKGPEGCAPQKRRPQNDSVEPDPDVAHDFVARRSRDSADARKYTTRPRAGHLSRHDAGEGPPDEPCDDGAAIAGHSAAPMAGQRYNVPSSSCHGPTVGSVD